MLSLASPPRPCPLRPQRSRAPQPIAAGAAATPTNGGARTCTAPPQSALLSPAAAGAKQLVLSTASFSQQRLPRSHSNRFASMAAAVGAGPSAAGGAAAAAATATKDDTFVSIPADAKVLLIGITGATGRSALQGLLAAAGRPMGRSGPHQYQLLAMSRNTQGAAARGLPEGVQVVAGDLDSAASLEAALRGVDVVYCHALSKDAVKADPQELVRARNLAAAAKAAGVRLIMYNSSGGRGCGYGITQMEQKHQVEDILAAAVPTVALQATLFMEELWKRYTRPGILKGTFTWSTPSDRRPLQLVAARDLGLVAGSLLASPEGGLHVPYIQRVQPPQKPQRAQQPLRLRALELAGDELTPAQMCEEFAKVQGRPVQHRRAPAWPFWFLARDVWRIARFLTERGYCADVAACRKQFPGMMTFHDFLVTSRWADPALSFEDGISFTSSPPADPAATSNPTATSSTPLTPQQQQQKQKQ
ncbi:hypothetical protein Agub_g2301 [Astrephomene gubernaculifera]|uniref:NmrA-like domain-containing protein n=1 Tax=Astrephomene gubernaculifera TaxID=47775 RepID=A0AAD3DGW9_9CHLO|nr:hypothetical protein Agub_g2301 [Astrephomene gubernaculifera]